MKKNINKYAIYVLISVSLLILIAYQLIITLILPFRYNIFILIIEIILFVFFLTRVIRF
jgi:hypothetical protein